MRVAKAILATPITLLRVLVAMPLVFVAIGADSRGDDELFRRLNYRIDKIIGA